MDLSRPHRATPAEVEALRESYRRSKGHSLPGFEFWLDVRPELVKRHRAIAVQIPSDETVSLPLPAVLAVLHYYAVEGDYNDGVAYEIHLSQYLGASDEDVWDTLAFAFIHAGPRGMKSVAEAGAIWKASSVRHERREGVFPDHWTADRTPLLTGIDNERAGLLPGERELIVRWYENAIGKVPRHVEYLLKHRPDMFKAWRSRFETAIAHDLPVQMVAYFMLHLNVHRGREEGIREAALTARHLRMSDQEIQEAVFWSIFYGGVDAIDVAVKVLEQLGIGD